MSRSTYAYAIANNDVCYIRWHYPEKIENCLGFSVHRLPASPVQLKPEWHAPLPTWVGFEAVPNKKREMKNSDIWPVQKYEWRDFTAPRDVAIKYRIVPMIGTPGYLQPDEANALETRTVSLTKKLGPFEITFNRGIISTQAIVAALGTASGKSPNPDKLRGHIQTPGDKVRERLAGQANDTILEFLQQADGEGKILAALYELTDQELIGHLTNMGSKIELVLSNADGSKKEEGEDGKPHTTKLYDDTNLKNRKSLMKDSEVVLTNRFLRSGAIGHNKFLIYVDGDDVPQAVLTGSTNWTPSGLCAQTNNIMVIRSPEIAAHYHEYWQRLKDDIDSSIVWKPSTTPKPNAPQNAPLRTEDAKPLAAEKLGGGEVKVWFSPNTKLKTKAPSNPVAPPDLEEVFDLISNAKKSVLFLAFMPGAPSIVQHIRDVHSVRVKGGKPLFVQGAATDPKAVGEFVDVIQRGTSRRVVAGNKARVSGVAGVKDEFGYWQKEIYKLGHAVIHDKIVVIDHWDPKNCVVITGSHNLGYKASYSNDENMVIVKGVRDVALAYAVHVLDISDHFRWRWRMQQDAAKPKSERGAVWSDLDDTDGWQDKYFQPTNPASHDANLLA